MTAADEFWEVVFEANWAHYLGQSYAVLVDHEPSTEATIPSGTLIAAAGWCAPYDPEAAPVVDTPTTDTPDPFMAAMVETAQRNLRQPGVAQSMVVPGDGQVLTASPEPLACGCSVGVLETAMHEPGCTVLDVPLSDAHTEHLNHWTTHPEHVRRPPSCVIPSNASLATAFAPEDAPPPGEFEQRFRDALDRHSEDPGYEPG